MNSNFKVKRNSNFELLRIISMFLIVMGHFYGQGIGFVEVNNFSEIVIVFLSSGSRIAVGLFLMIGVWFMVDQEFKPCRVLNLYSTLWFYTVSITLVLVVLGYRFGYKVFIGEAFPFIRGETWFIPSYISLLLLHPFINSFFKCGETKIRSFLIIGFILIIMKSTLASLMDTYLCTLVWFVYAYIFIGYYKKYVVNKINKKYIFLFIGIVIYICLVSTKIILSSMDSGVWKLCYKVVAQYLSDYKSLPSFLCALSVFTFFAKIDLGQSSIINNLAANTLDVYIIHQTGSFINVLWFDICKTNYWKNSKYVLLYFLCITLLIYVFCSMIGRIRKTWIEPLWQKSRVYKYIENQINRLYDFK